eukprot:2666923-Alexandrium_andersonii.AAC.1
MSASLVGSEMCIRDRRARASLSNPAHALLPTIRFGALVSSATQAGVAIPVSYTHLTLPTICSV